MAALDKKVPDLWHIAKHRKSYQTYIHKIIYKIFVRSNL